MSWLRVSLEVEERLVELLSDALIAAGAASVDVADAEAGSAAERPIFAEPGASAPKGWKRSRVSALLAGEADPSAILGAACAQLGVGVPRYAVERVPEQDWVRATQEQFRPVRISPRLWIVPSWHHAPDPAAINIVLDPGLAFGTGTHPTTRQCLRWLERNVHAGESVIDYGCGSGILAIAALKLGAGHAAGVDIDEQALLAARHNAMQNRVDVSFHSAAEGVGAPAQIVVANILAHPLIVLAPVLARLTRAQGRLALAGVLATQTGEVCEAYRPWVDIGVEDQEEEWVLLAGVRRSDVSAR
jgi:ribosomal protein L11 methyltransferase